MAKYDIITPEKSFEVEADFLLEAIEIANSENYSAESLDLIAVIDIERCNDMKTEDISKF